MASKKNIKKKQDQTVEDKTFGLKNKNKSAKVQKYIVSVTKNVKGDAMKEQERAKELKKSAKLQKMQADEEMRALFGEALNAKKNKVGKNKKDAAKDQAASLKKEESDKSKLMKDYPFIADEMLASTGMLNDLTPEELDIELKNFMANGESTLLTLEQVIELQRAKMRAEGNPGTPVTESSLADWKLRRAEKRRLAANAKVEAELKKKKGGKGLSVLSGKELYSYNATLFVDDDDADNDQYERCSDADSNEGEAEVDVDTDEGNGGGAEEEKPVEAAKDASAGITVAVQESLYLEGSDDDLDDLDDFDD